MSRRTASVALAVMAAGGLAGPAAGQSGLSSVWYNPEPHLAQTTSTLPDGKTLSLFVGCTSNGFPMLGIHAGGVNADPGGRLALAFRFDGDPETETVAMGRRLVGPGGDLAVLLTPPDARPLIVALRSADYVETGPAGGNWARWNLRGAVAAIDRLPCWGGDR